MPETYRYRLKSLGQSSAFYGNCEVCRKPVSDVFYQVEERKYWNGTVPNGEATMFGWTQYKCVSLFGHKECLKSRQRTLNEVDTSNESIRSSDHPN